MIFTLLLYIYSSGWQRPSAPWNHTDTSEGERLRADNMNKLLIITVLVTLIALSAESFRLPRQALEEKTDILTKVIDRIKSCYEDIPGGNLRLKAGALVNDAMFVWGMYMSMIQEHIYNLLYPRQ